MENCAKWSCLALKRHKLFPSTRVSILCGNPAMMFQFLQMNGEKIVHRGILSFAKKLNCGLWFCLKKGRHRYKNDHGWPRPRPGACDTWIRGHWLTYFHLHSPTCSSFCVAAWKGAQPLFPDIIIDCLYALIWQHNICWGGFYQGRQSVTAGCKIYTVLGTQISWQRNEAGTLLCDHWCIVIADSPRSRFFHLRRRYQACPLPGGNAKWHLARTRKREESSVCLKQEQVLRVLIKRFSCYLHGALVSALSLLFFFAAKNGKIDKLTSWGSRGDEGFAMVEVQLHN